MSRAEIAAALSTVEGVTGFKFRPTGLKKGAAWPLIDRLDRDQVSGQFATTWRIAVILPEDEEKASEWFDSMHEPITEALEDLGYVDLIEPGALVTSEGDLPIMILTLRREA
jgi:hypothetical protein